LVLAGFGARLDNGAMRLLRRLAVGQRGSRARCNKRAFAMMDVVYLGLTVGLFALTWGLVRICEIV
jgi:hypothetical protein